MACRAGPVHCGLSMFAGPSGEIPIVSVLPVRKPIIHYILPPAQPEMSRHLVSKPSARPSTMPCPQSEVMSPPLSSPATSCISRFPVRDVLWLSALLFWLSCWVGLFQGLPHLGAPPLQSPAGNLV